MDKTDVTDKTEITEKTDKRARRKTVLPVLLFPFCESVISVSLLGCNYSRLRE